jgi:hypothetical protein
MNTPPSAAETAAPRQPSVGLRAGLSIDGKYKRRRVTGTIVRSNGSVLQVRIDPGQPDADRIVWMRRDMVSVRA